MSKRAKSRDRAIRPQFWVFCEGQTEAEYVLYLRTRYRVPTEIVAKVAGSRVSKRLIENSKQGSPKHPKDRDFLLYDGDVESLLPKLESIPGATLLLSTPSIELWFYLHIADQKTALTSAECVYALSKALPTPYAKGHLSAPLRSPLERGVADAMDRARRLAERQNPSSDLPAFISLLEHLAQGS